MKKLFEDFIEVEYKNNFDEYEIKGIKFWHLIRFDIYNRILQYKEMIEIEKDVKYDKKKSKKILYYFKKIGYVLFYNPLFYNPLVFKKKTDILFLNHPRKIFDGKYYNSIYTELIAESSNYNSVFLETPYKGLHYKKKKNMTYLFTDYFDFRYRINKLLNPNFRKLNCDNLYHILEVLTNHFNVDFNIDYWTSFVTDYINKYNFQKKLYHKLIRKINPKIIIEVVYYTFNNMLINDIAKIEKIPTIELQHGVMGKYHIAYNFYKKKKYNWFPDYIFLYGHYWKNKSRLPIEDEHIKVVGWPYYEDKLEKNKIVHKLGIKSDKQIILFLSQPTIGKDLSQLAVNLYNLLDKNQYELKYKLHPREFDNWREEYKSLLSTKIQVIDTNYHDIHYYFSIAKIQIGVYSTSIYEGLGYNLKTYIFKAFGYNFMEDLYLKTNIKLVETAIDIKKDLDTLSNKYDVIESNSFWEKNSLLKVKSEIEKIMRNHKLN
jgi:hypothetical protein